MGSVAVGSRVESGHGRTVDFVPSTFTAEAIRGHAGIEETLASHQVGGQVSFHEAVRCAGVSFLIQLLDRMLPFIRRPKNVCNARSHSLLQP